jgi:hypothetical protein
MLFLGALHRSADEKKNNLLGLLAGLAGLFATFITLCGIAHLFSAIRYFAPMHEGLKFAQLVVLVICAVSTIVAAMISTYLLPRIFAQLSKYELSTEGNIQHVEEYLAEVVELVKESVVVLAEDLNVLRCNEASKTLFVDMARNQESITNMIHEEDVHKFQNAVQQALQPNIDGPVSVEYRVRTGTSNLALSAAEPMIAVDAEAAFPSKASPLRRSPSFSPQKNSTSKVFVTEESPCSSTVSNDPSWPGALSGFAVPISVDTAVPHADACALASEATPPQYVWVESTMCKGFHFAGREFEPDVKMVTRNIDGRRREAESQYQNVLRATEEQARINAAKLRYISCIAHDLKTPLQSFCFSLDLLGQTMLIPEQREYIQQANVAVGLMKLTISQTMDISKALSGAKLVPRCTTVSLSSVLDRVKVIM